MMRMRRACMPDVDAVTDLTVRAYAPYTEAFGAPPIPVTEDYAPRIGRGEVWLLEEDDRLAGLIVLAELPACLEIFSIAIAPERQGQGLGRRLLAFAEEEARTRGYATLALYTNARMTRNIAIYTACGFRETGRTANPRRPGWIRVDMEKALAAAPDRSEDRRSA
jgi:GNAT superfamily N-acetyltransferase